MVITNRLIAIGQINLLNQQILEKERSPNLPIKVSISFLAVDGELSFKSVVL